VLINCDIGERGAAHPVDDALMACIDIANVACGGHAGDAGSVAYYLELARIHGVGVSAHLSYPDRENFGRSEMELRGAALLDALDAQYALLPHVKRVKLHGALYNRANVEQALAESVAAWFAANGVSEVLTPHGSALHAACAALGIGVLEEAFLDRSYIIDGGRPALAPRSRPDALIVEPDAAYAQYRALCGGGVQCEGVRMALRARTLCVHSDSEASLSILRRIRSV